MDTLILHLWIPSLTCLPSLPNHVPLSRLLLLSVSLLEEYPCSCPMLKISNNFIWDFCSHPIAPLRGVVGLQETETYRWDIYVSAFYIVMSVIVLWITTVFPFIFIFKSCYYAFNYGISQRMTTSMYRVHAFNIKTVPFSLKRTFLSPTNELCTGL